MTSAVRSPESESRIKELGRVVQTLVFVSTPELGLWPSHFGMIVTYISRWTPGVSVRDHEGPRGGEVVGPPSAMPRKGIMQ